MNKFDVLLELSNKYTNTYGLETIEGFTVEEWYKLTVDKKIMELLKT